MLPHGTDYNHSVVRHDLDSSRACELGRRLFLRHDPAFLGYDIPGVGLLATLIIIMLFGVIMRTYLAKRIVLLGELILARIPIARGVYPGIKRLLQLVVGDSSAKSSRVVLAPYPHANSRAYAFVTGALMLPDESGREVEHLRVFVPTTPNPTSGFLLMVPTENTIATDLTMDEASKLIVSGGLV
jgi:uncharacterized membrane protein